MSDSNIRKAGEKLDYDQNMINEIIKCKNDILYFAETYYTIVTVDKGKQNIKLWDWQKKVLKAFIETPNDKQNCIIKIARQSGKCEFCDTIIKIRNKITGLVEETTIIELFSKIKQ